MIIAEISIVPIGTQKTSVSEFVANALKVLKDNTDIEYELNCMGTVIRTKEYKTLYNVITLMQEEVIKFGADRLYTVIKIDDRRDKQATFSQKINSVEKHLSDKKIN